MLHLFAHENNKVFIYTKYYIIEQIKLPTFELEKMLPCERNVSVVSLAVSIDCKYLFSVNRNNKVYRYDLETQEMVLFANELLDRIKCHGNILFGISGHKICYWDIESKELFYKSSYDFGSIIGFELCGDFLYLITYEHNEGKIIQYDYEKNQTISYWKINNFQPCSITIKNNLVFVSFENGITYVFTLYLQLLSQTEQTDYSLHKEDTFLLATKELLIESSVSCTKIWKMEQFDKKSNIKNFVEYTNMRNEKKKIQIYSHLPVKTLEHKQRNFPINNVSFYKGNIYINYMLHTTLKLELLTKSEKIKKQFALTCFSYQYRKRMENINNPVFRFVVKSKLYDKNLIQEIANYL